MLQKFKKSIDVLMGQIKVYFEKTTPPKNKHNPVTPTSLVRGQTPDQAKYSTPQTKKFYKRRKWFIKENFIREYLVVFATLAMAFFTYRLFEIATKQTKIANDSAIAAIAAANAAMNSIELSKQIADREKKFTEIEMRAYLAIDTIKFSQFRIGKVMIVDVQVINVGKTPAYNVMWWGATRTGGGFAVNYREEINIIKSFKYEGAPFTLNPNIRYHVKIIGGRILDEGDSVNIRKGSLPLFAFGEFDYSSVFGGSHYTKRCMSYSPALGLFVSHKPTDKNYSEAN